MMRELLELLVQPIAWGLIVSGYGLWRLRSRIGERPYWPDRLAVFGWLVIGVASSPLVARFTIAGWERPAAREPRQPESADVLVVLGGGIKIPPREGPAVLASNSLYRTLRAFELHRQTGLPIVVSGGPADGPGSLTVAGEMAKLLVELGVPETEILREEVSTSTRSNAVETVRILRERGFKRPILVTSALHVRRAELLFAQLGIPVDGVGCDFRQDRFPLQTRSLIPSNAALAAHQEWLHEALGMVDTLARPANSAPEKP
jgi:uncharacterized SAM-binding protein YcdF (DUF218 family)